MAIRIDLLKDQVFTFFPLFIRDRALYVPLLLLVCCQSSVNNIWTVFPSAIAHLNPSLQIEEQHFLVFLFRDHTSQVREDRKAFHFTRSYSGDTILLEDHLILLVSGFFLAFFGG